MAAGVGGVERAVREDELGGDDVVDREAVLAGSANVNCGIEEGPDRRSTLHSLANRRPMQR
jgi:hypothetical protein